MPDILRIRRAVAVVGATEDAVATRLEEHRESLPRAQGRRMSPLGLALDLALAGDTPSGVEPLVYVSCYAMARSLEDFLASFPHPSPLAFQNAIHPAGIEQHLVTRRIPVGELTPVATEPETGMAPALRTLFLSPGATRRLAGGEERGTWLAEFAAAADRTFAFALTFSTMESPDDLGTLTRDAFDGTPSPLSTDVFAEAVAARRPVVVAAPGFGRYTLAWR